MTKRTLDDLEAELRGVAQGVRPPSSPPVEATPRSMLGVVQAHLDLLRLIAQRQPESVTQLAEMTERAQSNVSRTLQELARHGLIRLVRDGKSIRPVVTAGHIDIDLFQGTCRIVPRADAAE